MHISHHPQHVSILPNKLQLPSSLPSYLHTVHHNSTLPECQCSVAIGSVSLLISTTLSLIVEVRRVILIRIILVPLSIVIVVHILGVALGVSSCLDPVVLVHAFGFGELVNFCAGEAHEELFGEGVIYDFACFGQWLTSMTRQTVVEGKMMGGRLKLPSLR
jgi:hypothetical protein